MCECRLFYLGVFVLCNVFLVTSFNIEKTNYAIYKSQSSSMFGFTVALHKDTANRPWVLVGAPEAQARYHDQREIRKGGAVYKCDPLRDNRCEEIRMNPSQNKRMERQGNTYHIDDQSYQWFGATLTTSRAPNKPVVACAPRYTWFTRDRNRKDPVGTCFIADAGLDNYQEYSPCRTMNWGYHRQGSCQAGFSAAINSEGDLRLYVGAPGSYYWQGQIYSIDAHANFTYTPLLPWNSGFGAKGTVFQQILATKPAVISTREGSPRDDDSYIGYSLVAGRFRVLDPDEGIAVGMPRGNKLKGKILLFSWNLQNYKNLTISDQIGSYFGYSITAADVNGDGYLDIIVGAPMYTKANNELKYDLGRVYIFFQTDDETTSFNSPNTQFLDGEHSRGRFGHAVSTLGDLNQDGFDDFAVGAPYGGLNGNGAVYIYYGSKQGVREKYGQVVYAEDVYSSYPIQTFGFSVTGGVDLDNNEYPDMAVGAYLSDTAFFFRARPTVVVDAYVSFSTIRKQVDIAKGNCNIGNSRDNSDICTSVKFCIKYTGKGIPQRMEMNLEYILDSKKVNGSSKGGRMFFRENSKGVLEEAMMLYNNADHQCKEKQIYISGKVRDKLTPLEAKVNYKLKRHVQGERNPEAMLNPVLDLSSPPSRHDTLFIQKDCGDDGKCIPDLHLNVTSDSKIHYFGSEADIGFDIVVSNFGEDAFETTFVMKYPEGVQFKYSKIDPDMSGILCTSDDKNLQITCDIGNPLPKRKIAKFRLLFQPPNPTIRPLSPRYDFEVFVNSSNPEESNTKADNEQRISLDIWVQASLELRGDTYPPKVYLDSNDTTKDNEGVEGAIGPQVAHVYYLRNGGPSTIDEAEVYILWPYQTLGGDDLLYLLEPPQVQGDVKCDAFDKYGRYYDKLKYNYKGYRLERTGKTIWERLKVDISRVETQTDGSRTQTTEVDKGGVLSGVGVDNSKANTTRYEKVYTQVDTVNNKTVTSHGTMTVDEYGNSRTSFEENRSPTISGSQSETRQYQNVNQQGRTTGRQQTGGQFGAQGGTHYREEAYEVGGGPYEGGSQSQNVGRQYSTEQSYRQNNNQQGSGENWQYYEHGSAGGSRAQNAQRQFSTEQSYRQNNIQGAGAGENRQYNEQGSAGNRQYGQRQYSSQNRTFAQGQAHGVDGGGNLYYEQRGSPGDVVYRRTYTVESSTTIPIDMTQLQGGRPLGADHQSLDEVAAGQGYRVQLIGMDNTASEISIADTNRGIYDHSGRPALSREEYNRTYTQGRDGDYDQRQRNRYRDSYNQQGGSRSRQWSSESSYSQSGHVDPSIYQNSLERDNVPTDRPSDQNQGRRGKRAYDYLEDIRVTEKCSSATCAVIKCKVRKVHRDKEVVILLRSRLNVKAVENITLTESIKLSSMMIAKVTKLPFIGEPSQLTVKKHEITTEVPAKTKDFEDQVPPLWVYVVSAVAGVIMLLLLIWILHKCGFFKRNRPSSGPERQPLNRNGYHSGDEAL